MPRNPGATTGASTQVREVEMPTNTDAAMDPILPAPFGGTATTRTLFNYSMNAVKEHVCLQPNCCVDRPESFPRPGKAGRLATPIQESG